MRTSVRCSAAEVTRTGCISGAAATADVKSASASMAGDSRQVSRSRSLLGDPRANRLVDLPIRRDSRIAVAEDERKRPPPDRLFGVRAGEVAHEEVLARTRR